MIDSDVTIFWTVIPAPGVAVGPFDSYAAAVEFRSIRGLEGATITEYQVHPKPALKVKRKREMWVVQLPKRQSDADCCWICGPDNTHADKFVDPAKYDPNTVPVPSEPQISPADVQRMVDELNAKLRNDVVANVLGHDVTRGQLEGAFRRVADQADWKNPIDAVVDLNDQELALLRKAIPYITGSKARFQPRKGAEPPRIRYRVQARGYYANMAPWC
jgi:hypothetical protein